ncbi:MAG: hypothetical protein AAFQ65_07655 [Myxococcota bacterium]
MYREHFGLTHYPFDKTLQLDELYDSKAMRQAAARLNHLVELRGIGLITREPDSVRTTACRKLIDI